ncbi:MAG: zinc-ribbon domain-containing protein [Candidatus Helarchaeota archaeon]
MSEKLEKLYTFKISKKMLEEMREYTNKVKNWSEWIRNQIAKKIEELKSEKHGFTYRYCSECGAIIEEGDVYCMNCGQKVKV